MQDDQRVSEVSGATRSPRVLVLGAGSAPGVSILKALQGLDVELCAAGQSPYLPGLYMVDERFVLSAAGEPGFAEQVASLARRERIDVVVPAIDDEVAALHASRADMADVTVAMHDPQTLDACLDKWDFWLRLRDSGVPLPRTWLPAQLAGEGLHAAVIAKPRLGSGADGVRRITDASELHELDDSYVVQEELPGEEVSVDVYVNGAGRVLAAVPRRRLRTELGISMCGQTFRDAELQAMAAQVAEHVGGHGILNIQFKQDADGQYRLLEVNPRCPGGMSLTVASGVNMPAMLVRELLGEELAEPVDFEELAMVRYREEIFMPPDALLDDAQ
ncbi:MAG: hypothetical protein JWM86_1041 [Thermoleophilia bacterium]|nr:hypothetical protein [Thermoleophilia bacterium]